jgi:orotate phosphoribosyltransferase
MKHQKLVNNLYKHKVFIDGEFVVRSGKTLKTYCNLKKAYGYPRLANEISKLIALEVPKSTTCLAVLGFGGLPLGALVSRVTNLPVCYIRDGVKSHGTKSQLEGYMPNSKDKLVILDDVYTTGNSLRTAVDILDQYKINVSSAVVFLEWNKPNEKFKVKSVLKGKQIINK